MIPEIILLALVSTVRPTSLAAVYALVTQGSVRFLWAYVVAGLAFAIAFGVLVVGVFHGIHVQAGTNGTRAVANIIGGSASSCSSPLRSQAAASTGAGPWTGSRAGPTGGASSANA